MNAWECQDFIISCACPPTFPHVTVKKRGMKVVKAIFPNCLLQRAELKTFVYEKNIPRLN